MPIKFKEDTLKLDLEVAVLQALTQAIQEQTDDLENNMDYAYQTTQTRFGYGEFARLRDLKRLHLNFSQKLEDVLLTSRTRVKISVPVSYAYLLHCEVKFSFGNIYLQQAIDKLDQAIKSYRFSYRLRLRQ